MKFISALLVLIVLFGCTSNQNPIKNSTINVSISVVNATMSNKEIVVLETNKGNIEIELNPDKAPVTVKNFINYVNSGFYNGTIFHRVIKGFMIQGGGFTQDGNQKKTSPPITLESNNGLSNVVGTIAMARTSDPNSATAQFFINTVNNSMLDYSPGNDGYAVFGKVVSGMDVVSSIESVPTGNNGPFQDWPTDSVIITGAHIK